LKKKKLQMTENMMHGNMASSLFIYHTKTAIFKTTEMMLTVEMKEQRVVL